MKLQRAAVLLEVKANTKKNLTEAIRLYVSSLDADGVDAAARVRGYVDLSRAYLRLGDLTIGKAGRIALYKKGQKAAQRAQELDPKNADAKFWDVANMATIGQTQGVMNSLFMLADLKTGLRDVLKLDPNHHYARETLGRVYHAVPGMVGGSDKEALALFKECIRRDPRFTPCKITLARFYVDDGEDEKARALYQEVLNEKNSSVPNDFRKFNVPDAKADLAKLK